MILKKLIVIVYLCVRRIGKCLSPPTTTYKIPGFVPCKIILNYLINFKTSNYLIVWQTSLYYVQVCILFESPGTLINRYVCFSTLVWLANDRVDLETGVRQYCRVRVGGGAYGQACGNGGGIGQRSRSITYNPGTQFCFLLPPYFFIFPWHANSVHSVS